MSKHSIRSGASRRWSASWSSVSALDRALWSAARRRRWRARSSPAERVTVSCSARLAPRWGTTMSTGPSRRVRSQLQSSSRSAGISGTSTRRGTSVPTAP